MKLSQIVIALGLSLSMMACKPSAEREQTRYTAGKDRLEALGTKNPTMKADIKAKLAEFEKSKQEADAKTGEQKATALSELNGRIDAYEKSIAPAAGSGRAAPVLGSKLGSGSGSGSGAAVVPGGKLSGGLDAGVPMDAPPAGGKLGGSAAPGKSGFSATPDAPAAPPKSGFGGK